MTSPADLERYLYCLDANLPHPVTAALLTLVDDPGNLHTAWLVWSVEEYGLSDRDQFAAAVEFMTSAEIVTCDDCGAWEWDDYTTITADDDVVCDSHLNDDDYRRCNGCDKHRNRRRMTYVDDYWYCDDECLDNHCFFCHDCDAWSRWEHEHDNEDEDDCDCDAPHVNFEFPANGHGTIGNDDRLDVTLPAGTIDSEGIRSIRMLLISNDIPWDAVDRVILATGDKWQGKKGNFTKRLSRELYATYSIKIPAPVLSEIGNLARQHSSTTSDWAVEFTRRLNLDADDFCHDDSCWWQSYYKSRCALKNWGGLGMRAFDSYDTPVGRAWVQPLDADLQPTHDTLGAHAYLVYNSYGQVDEYKAARIVAHLTGRTYRKVVFMANPQYVNSNMAILVADEATCLATSEVNYTFGEHDHRDAYTMNQENAA